MPIFSFASFSLDRERRVLLQAGRALRVGGRAFDVLAILVGHAGEVLTNADLSRAAWPAGDVGAANVRVHIAALRRLLGDGRQGARYIVNVSGRGYCFVADVSTAADEVLHEEPEAPPPTARDAHAAPVVIGRMDDVLATCAALLAQGQVSIVGAGGIGKTTLARLIVARLAQHFAERICWIDLSPVADPSLVPDLVAGAFGVPSTTLAPLPALVAQLKDNLHLIVLDNCEHVVAPVAALVEALRRGAPRVHILATSREALKTEGEHVYRLPPLAVPAAGAALSVRDALDYAAVELFVERATARVDGFSLSDTTTEDVGRICRRLDGLPLAIEMAAAASDVFGIPALATQLDQRFDVLTRGRRTAPARHRTLWATYEWSYELLSPEERALLRRLGMFAGPFTWEAAGALEPAGENDEDALLETLGNLIDKSLVVPDAQAYQVVFHLLNSTRVYAREKLSAEQEFDAVAQRHADHCLALLRGGVDPAGAAAILDEVRAALDWCHSRSGDAHLAVALTLAAVPLWAQLTLTTECMQQIERARALYQREGMADPAQEIELWLAAGLSLLYTRGPRAEAGAALQRAAELEGVRRAPADMDRTLRVYNAVHLYFNVRSEARAALAIAWRFQRRLRALENHPAQSIAQYMIGTSLHSLGEQRRALSHLERAITGYDRAARVRLTRQLFMDRLTSARVIKAYALWLTGFADQARRTADAAFDDASHALSRCHAVTDGTGTLALLCGDLDALERSAGKLVELADANRLPGWRIFGVVLEHVAAVRREASPAALADLRRSLAEWEDATGYRHRRSLLVTVLAEGYAAAGQLSEARKVLADTLQQGQRGEADWILAEVLRVDGELALLDGHIAGEAHAERRFEESLDWARRQSALGWALRSATSLARLWDARGQRARAHALLSPVLGRFSEGFSTLDVRVAAALLERLTTGRAG
jgi:predicted ATPase/DNA-binding winged helix-turn-helix (wHTH) protein